VYFSRALKMKHMPTGPDRARHFQRFFCDLLRHMRMRKFEPAPQDAAQCADLAPLRLPEIRYGKPPAALPVASEAMRFVLPGNGARSAASWKGSDTAPLGYHRGDSYDNPGPSAAFLAYCPGAGATGGGAGRRRLLDNATSSSGARPANRVTDRWHGHLLCVKRALLLRLLLLLLLLGQAPRYYYAPPATTTTTTTTH